MANKAITIHIKSALDAAGINATKEQVATMAKTIRDANAESAKKSSTAWTEFYSKFRVIAGGVKAAWSAVKFALNESFKFEEQTRQFKFLTGSIDDAKAHMADLKALGDTPPFSLDEFARTSRSMMVMSEGALGYKKSLELVGDAAAATGVPLEAMGHAVGRLYGLIRDGQPVSRATMELRNMGAITPEVAARLSELQDAGASNAQIWAEVETALERFSGAMAETEQTGKGLLGAIESRWTNLVRQFGDAFLECAEGGMTQALDAMKRLEEDGSIGIWANDTVSWLERVAEGASATAGALGKIVDVPWKFIKAQYEAIGQSVGGMIGAAAGGGGIRDVLAAGWQGVKDGVNDVFDFDGAEAEYRARQRERLLERRRRRRQEKEAAEASRASVREEAEKKRVQEQLAASQKKLDADRAKKAEEAAKKAADAELKARQKAEAELHRQRLDNIRAEIKARETSASALEQTASAARSEFDRAFAMYRDPERAKDEIAEERDYASDYRRLKKDASRYGGKWRIDELASLMAAGDAQGQAAKLEEWRKSRSFTPEVEAMVRASAADQTHTTAEDELRQINANTKNLADKLDQLLQVKG